MCQNLRGKITLGKVIVKHNKQIQNFELWGQKKHKVSHMQKQSYTFPEAERKVYENRLRNVRVQNSENTVCHEKNKKFVSLNFRERTE